MKNAIEGYEFYLYNELVSQPSIFRGPRPSSVIVKLGEEIKGSEKKFMKETNIPVPVTENIVIHLVSFNTKITFELRANPYERNFVFRIGFYREYFELTTSSSSSKLLIIFKFLLHIYLYIYIYIYIYI